MKSLKIQALMSASGVAVYSGLVGMLMINGNKWFGTPNNFLGPTMFLVLFVMSALLTALMVFYRPYLLFFDGKKKQAVNLVVYTTGWLFVYLVVLMVVVGLMR